MNGKLKALGLALVAVFALSAVAASGASAEGVYTSGLADTTISGSQTTKNVFTTSVGEVTCTTATFSGTTAATSSTDLTITPAYSGCKVHSIFGELNATVDVNGCTYTFTTPTTTGKAAPNDWHAEVHILCPAGKEIEVTAPGCNIFVHEQTPTVPTASMTNSGGAGTAMDVLVTSAVAGITYKTEGFTCGSHEENNGTYSGGVTVKGLSGVNPVSVTLSHP